MSENNPYAPPKAAADGTPRGQAPETTGDTAFKRRKTIGGWLILVVIGLMFTVVRLSYYVFTAYVPIFANGAWENLTTPGSEHYHPLWGPMIIFEIIGNLGSVVLAVLALMHMFRYSRKTPKFAIGMHVWGAVFVTADYVLGDFIPALSAQTDPESIKELTRAFIGTVIWVPYFLVSKRVKETFVE